MLPTIRTTLLVCAALSASSVAPAKVGPAAEPLVAVNSAVIPTTVQDELAASQLPQDQAALPGGDEAIEEVAEEAVDAKKDLATLVSEFRSTDPGSRELECLAAGIYFESKGEPLIGQLAVGEVIANRAESGRFPSTYCGVLFQRGQFSFVRRGKMPPIPRSSRHWQTAVAVAKIVDRDLKDSKADDALFFHARHVSPKWRLKRVASIGNHIFYR